MRPNTARTFSISAPVNGLVASSLYQGGEIGMGSAIWMYNIIPDQFGCRVRPGSKEIATNILDKTASSGEVRTYINFSQIDGTKERYAATDDGIYDITSGGSGPHTRVLEWPSKADDAGWCSYIHYTNVNGDNFLLLCDEANGYYIYNGSTWAVGTFTGTPAPNASDLVHITEWNNRIWFVEKNTGNSWYLDPLAITGSITNLNTASRYRRGGNLVAQENWTLDASDGMDDKLVQLSSAGEVLVWSTTSTGMQLSGRWFVGRPPKGRRVMMDWGGDLVILTASGIVSIGSLIAGTASVNTDSTVTSNVSLYITDAMDDYIDNYGWGLESSPKQKIAIISVPDQGSNAPIQFVVNATTKKWCMFRGLDICSMRSTEEGFYFGTRDGRLMELTGTLDEVNLAGTSSTPIEFSFMTHYSNLGVANKIGQYLTPSWLGGADPAYEAQLRWNFDLEEVTTTPAFVQNSLAKFDSAIWDQSKWVGSAQSYQETIGVTGLGEYLSIAIRGKATTELTYLGSKLICTVGGVM